MAVRDLLDRRLSWALALALMAGFAAVLWVVAVVDADDHWRLNRFGMRPRQVDGLWGIVTQPFLHASYSHLLSNTGPVVLIGWVLLLSGLRTWLLVTGFVVVVGGVLTWLVAPSGLIVGASAMVFGWMGYVLARAYFSRRLLWIAAAVGVLVFFGTLLGGLLPTVSPTVSWQSHLCGFGAGVLLGGVRHPRRPVGDRKGLRRILSA